MNSESADKPRVRVRGISSKLLAGKAARNARLKKGLELKAALEALLISIEQKSYRGAVKVNLPQKAKSRDLRCFVDTVASSDEGARLTQIKAGYPASVITVIRDGLNLTNAGAAELFEISVSTLERHQRNEKELNIGVSERVDRVALITKQAIDVFEDQDRAVQWLQTPNLALGNEKPIALCSTEIGSSQVRRLLTAIEYGHVA
ncbi:type II RES/Xre toxin-antitoxin system antitoxin [Pseudomonas peli]|uniref:type II RES/Xre toxin-antitoxin system antitoxin n=1 Tax=Pseudomonas peli TaxID=592361 RepID=UPI00285B39C3|nr:antitoxin Xre/MbcA/ParS toxin-binding domain-containing protein [Pseudomonas peli]MDR7024163.1 putative toxin-antitoxin system antitoxin component (TIGR02293 family) [Pseudomonas peli]